jgi:hypothetical protein
MTAARMPRRVSRLPHGIPGDLLRIALSWTISKFLDGLLLQGPREILASSPGLYIDRPGEGWDVVLYYSVAALLVGIASWCIRRWVAVPERASLYSIGAMLILCGVALRLSDKVLVPKVAAIASVSGEISDASLHGYLFVRPLSMGECWLQQPVPLMPDAIGKWRTQVFLGGASGEHFELMLVGSRDAQHPTPFSVPGGYPCAAISRGWPRFVRLVALR